MLKSPPRLGFYYTPYFVALRGLCGLVRVPWSASNLLTQIESRQNYSQNPSFCTMALLCGSWFPVHGPRQDGAETPGQVSCSGMGSVLSYGEATKPHCKAQARFDRQWPIEKLYMNYWLDTLKTGYSSF